MSENNAANEEKTFVKEKKSLDPRIALAIMIVMICCALCIGANKVWKKNRVSVDAAYIAWEDNIQQRVETAYNLLIVAGRYLPATDAQVASVRNDLKTMESADTADRVSAGETFLTDAQSLLASLAANQAVQSDSRDTMYVTLMLPQAVEQCSNNAAMTAYNAAAQSYNDGLRSFSGLLARLTGIDYAPTLTVGAAE